MLLAQLRQKKIHFISTLLITFVMMTKVFVPLAHISNVTNNQKGFLASLCSGNKVVFVALNLPVNGATNNEPETSGENTSECPLCHILEHEPPSNTIESNRFLTQQLSHHYNGVELKSIQHHLTLHNVIRGPPYFS